MTDAIVYRGPLERARIAFLAEAVSDSQREPVFIWITPARLSAERREISLDFIRTLGIEEIHVLEHSLREIRHTRSEIARILGGHAQSICAIGFSSLAFLRKGIGERLIWCVNGIPEEEDMTSGSRKVSLRSRVSWLMTRSRRPDIIIVVSEPMARLVRRYHRWAPIHVAPTCADVTVFERRPGEKRQLFGYLGTGAAWQAIDLLSNLWQEIHRLDPDIRFRVISRDPRTRVLATGLDEGHIEFVGSSDFTQVAEWLRECEVGFLLRRDELVNRVSFPTKLGEYLAAGAWVVSSDFDWDVARYLSDHNCGVLIAPDSSVESAARDVLNFREAVRGGQVELDLASAAEGLDRRVWVERTRRVLAEIPPPARESEHSGN